MKKKITALLGAIGLALGVLSFAGGAPAANYRWLFISGTGQPPAEYAASMEGECEVSAIYRWVSEDARWDMWFPTELQFAVDLFYLDPAKAYWVACR